jgi:hypothetical protein
MQRYLSASRRSASVALPLQPAIRGDLRPRHEPNRARPACGKSRPLAIRATAAVAAGFATNSPASSDRAPATTSRTASEPPRVFSAEQRVGSALTVGAAASHLAADRVGRPAGTTRYAPHAAAGRARSRDRLAMRA